jgi:hypothetical protein
MLMNASTVTLHGVAFRFRGQTKTDFTSSLPNASEQINIFYFLCFLSCSGPSHSNVSFYVRHVAALF